MKLKGLLKVALVLLAISTMFVACDTLAGGQFPEFFPTGDIIGDMCGDGADLTYDDATESYSYKFTYSKDMNAWAGKPGQINFKLRPVAGDWSNSYGATADKLTINGDKAEIALGGGNITVEGLVEGEEYVITLTAAEGKLYLTITGKLGDTPAEPEPEPEPEPDPEDPEDPEEPAIVLTPASSTGVWSYTLPIAEISTAWDGSSKTAVFKIMLMTDDEVAVAKLDGVTSASSENITIYTHAAGNYSLKDAKGNAVTGVAAIVTETDLTVIVDGAQLNLAEGKRPYVLALASKANASDDFCFNYWNADVMKMTPDATYPTDLTENVAPAGTPENMFKLNSVCGEFNGWTDHENLESFVLVSDGSQVKLKFTCGNWDVSYGIVDGSINEVGTYKLGGSDDVKVTLPAGSYKFSLNITETVAEVKVEKI